MFINYAILVTQILILLAYATANILMVINYSINTLWLELWVEQKWFGKVCANVFYLPAWVINLTLTAIVCALSWVSFGIYHFGQMAVKLFKPLYAKAIKLNL